MFLPPLLQSQSLPFLSFLNPPGILCWWCECILRSHRSQVLGIPLRFFQLRSYCSLHIPMLSQDPSSFSTCNLFCTAFFLIFRSSIPVLLALFCVLIYWRRMDGTYISENAFIYSQRKKSIIDYLLLYSCKVSFQPEYVHLWLSLCLYIYIYIYIYI